MLPAWQLTSGGAGLPPEAVVPKKPVPSERQVWSLQKGACTPPQERCGIGQRATKRCGGFRLSDQISLKIIILLCLFPTTLPAVMWGLFLIYTNHFLAHYEYWLCF